MPAKISLPLTKEFRLELLDERQGIPEAEATKVEIKQATLHENSQRANLFSEYITERDTDRQTNKERVIWRLPLYGLMTEEVFLTLVGCNLTVADGKETLFKFAKGPNGPFLDMTKDQFIRAWGLLDDAIAAEIHSKVLEVNVHWNMNVNQTNLGE